MEHDAHDKTIKYGDEIMLQSSELPLRFMAARSLKEEQMFFLEILLETSDITMYDNFCECVF